MERWDDFEIVWATISWDGGSYTDQFIVNKEPDQKKTQHDSLN